MLANSYTKWLWDGRRWLIGWVAAIAGVGGMYAAFWPTMNNPQMIEALENYPAAVLEALNYTDIATPAGYLNATVYGLIVAILGIVFATSAGTKTVAGDEEAGTLDLILAHPVTRSRLALQRFAAFLTGVILIAGALLLVLLAITGPAELEGISIGAFAAMNLHLFFFLAFFGSVAYAVGAATGRRGLTIAVTSGVGVFGFAANGILPQIEGMEWIKDFSPFKWLNGSAPLQNGVEAGDVLIMAMLAVVLVAIGTWAFTRRDIGV